LPEHPSIQSPAPITGIPIARAAQPFVGNEMAEKQSDSELLRVGSDILSRFGKAPPLTRIETDANSLAY